MAVEVAPVAISDVRGEVSGDMAGDIFGMFCGVIALFCEPGKVFVGDITGNVVAIEDGRVKVLQIGCRLLNAVDQVVEILKDELVAADIVRELTDSFAVSD
jgi:hypothetical protein